jgi:predicted NBD/HSP70 family sugar kinase
MRNASGRRRRHQKMRHYVGFDVGKGSHWACVLDGEGEVIISRRVEAKEEALEAFCSEIAELGVTDERVFGIDLTGGPAALCWRRCCSGEKVRYVYPERR